MTEQGSGGAFGAEEAKLAGWIERNVGGTVTRISRMSRWRPAWDVDVEIDGTVLPLHARGEREATILMPIRIADEIPAHDLLEEHGIPVPHAFGLCDDPYSFVMDRLAGHVDLASGAADDLERYQIVDEYLMWLRRIYEIPLDAVAAKGFAIPEDDATTALAYIRRIEALYDPQMEGHAPDPHWVFLRQWLIRNVPQGRTASARFIPFDSFQFMFDQGKITGIIDLELAHVGDPMMDLAALRTRDTIKNVGDLVGTGERYAEITGVELDHDVIDYHTVLYNAVGVPSIWPALLEPTRQTDWVTYMAWYVNGVRWCYDTIAEIAGYELDTVDVPEPRPTRHAAPIRHLVAGLRASASGSVGEDYERVALGRIGTHLRRLDEVGPALAAADLDQLADSLGHRPDPAEADAELVAMIRDAGPERDEEIVRLLDARIQRVNLTLASPGSMILRHPRLRSLRPDRAPIDRGTEEWPAGMIPGTA